MQVQRPGASSFVNWKTAQTALTSPFVPDAGTGTYTFRARVRNPSNAKTSAWSPTAGVTVS